jgi:hypothetical protein
MVQQERRCPFCEETVLEDTAVCHFCGRDLPSFERGAASSARGAWRVIRALLIVVIVVILVVALVLALRRGQAPPLVPPVAALAAGLPAMLDRA